MAEYKYSVRIEVGIGTAGVKQGSNAVKAELSDWQAAAIKAAEAVEKSIAGTSASRAKTARQTGDLEARVFQESQKRIVETNEAANASIIGNYIKRGQAAAKVAAEITKAEKQTETEANASQQRRNANAKRASDVQLKLFQESQKNIIQANEAASESIIGNYIKRGQAANKAAKDAENAARRAARAEFTALTEVQRINNETRRQAERNDRLIEQSQKTLADVRIREARRSAKAFADSLGKKPGGGGGGGAGGVGEDIFGAVLGATTLAGFAVIAATKIVDTMKGIIQSGIATAIEAGVEAARFERVRQGLIAVSESAAEADQLIGSLLEKSRTSPGLDFKTAVEGAQRLRAAGFEAGKARDIIGGLSKVRLISGSTQQDLEAVILNFSQIRAIGKLTGDELRETLGRMPAFSRVLQQAFGTISIEKLRLLDLTADELFDATIKAMKDLPEVAGNTETAFNKLTQEYELALIAFGTPLLEPTTEILKELTSLLKDNQESFKEWGQLVGDVLRGVAATIKTLREAASYLPQWLVTGTGKAAAYQGAGSTGTFATGGGLAGGSLATIGLSMFRTYGEVKRRIEQQHRDDAEAALPFEQQFPGFKPENFDPETNTVKNLNVTLDKQKEFDTKFAESITKAMQTAQDARDNDLKNTESFYSQKQSLLDSSARFSASAETKYLQDSADITQQSFDARIKILQDYLQSTNDAYEKIKQSFKGTEIEPVANRNIEKKRVEAAAKIEADIGKLQSEQAQKNAENQRKIRVSEIKDQEQLLQRSRETELNDARRAYRLQESELGKHLRFSYQENYQFLVDTAKLQETAYRASFQAIKNAGASQENLYAGDAAKQLEIRQKTIEELTQLSNDYAVQQNENARKAAELAEQELTRRRQVAVTTAQIRAQEAQFELAKNQYAFGRRQQFGNPNDIEILGSDLSAQLTQIKTTYGVLLKTARTAANAQIDNAHGQADEIENINRAFALESDKIQREQFETELAATDAINAEILRRLELRTERETQILSAQGSLTKSYFQTLREGLERGNADLATFAENAERLAKFDTGGADSPVAKSLLDASHTARNLIGKSSDEANRVFLAKQQKFEIDALDARRKGLLNQREAAKDNAAKLTEIEQQLTLNTFEQLEIRNRHVAESASFEADTYEGLAERLRKIRGNDPALLKSLDERFSKDRVRAQIATAEQIRQVEQSLTVTAEEASDRYRLAWVTAVKEVADAHLQAIEEQIRAEVRLADKMVFDADKVRARVLSHLAEQKSISEATGDGIIQLYDKIATASDKQIDKLYAKMGAFGSVFAEPFKAVARGFLTDITKSALDIFYPGASKAFDKQQNPVAAELSELNRTSKKIEENTRNGGFGAGAGFGSGFVQNGNTGGANANTNPLAALLGLITRGRFGSGGSGGATGVMNANAPFLTGGFAGGANPVAALLSGASGGNNQQAGIAANFLQSMGIDTGGGAAGTRPRIVGEVANTATGGSSQIRALQGLISKIQKTPGIQGGFAGAGLGAGLGQGSVLGSILGGAGGLIGGTLLTGLVTTGSVAGATTGGIFGASAGLFGLGGAATLGIGAAVAGVALAASYFIGRDAKRKREEKARTQILGDAKTKMGEIISLVNSDKLDGASALQQANQIRAQYLAEVGKLTDKKTRRIAEQTVRELDYMINQQLKPAIEAQDKRRAKLDLLVPTFAMGGSIPVSPYQESQVRINPVGYARGAGTGKSDSMLGYSSRAKSLFRYSNTEYILDADTVRNIGVANLDYIRESKGKTITPYISQVTPGYATGGSLSNDSGYSRQAVAQPQNEDNQPMQLNLNANVVIGRETFVEIVDGYLQSPEGKTRQVTNNREHIKKQGVNGDGWGKDLADALQNKNR